MKILTLVFGLMGLASTSLFAQIEEWEWLSPIPQGNELYDICVINDSTIIATGDLGTVIRSENGGVDWHVQHHAGYSNRALWAVDFIDERNGWIVGEDGTLLSSMDGGETWSPQTSNIQTHLYDICFVDSRNGWSVGRWGKMLRTTDGGSQWSEEHSETLRGLHSIEFVHDSLGFIVGSGGTILRTQNGGMSWEHIESGSPCNLKDVSFVSEQLGLVVGENGSVLKSMDGGTSWHDVDTGHDVDFHNVVWSSDSTALISGYKTQHEFGWSYRMDPLVLQTSDAGTTWQSLAENSYLPILNSVTASNGIVWGAGENGTLLCSHDGGNSMEFKNVNISPVFWQVHFYNSMLGWAVGGKWVARTHDGGSTWQTTELDSAYFLHTVDFVSPDTGWAAGGSYVVENNQLRLVGELYKSCDGGATWKKQQVDGLKRILHIDFTNSVLGCMSGDDGQLYRTTDGGATWEELNTRTRGYIFDAYFMNDSTGLYCGEGRIARTVDGGTRWSTVYSNSQNVFFSMHVVDPATIYASGSSGLIVKSTDGGETWKELETGIHNELWAVYFLIPRVGWAVGNEGMIIKTLDYGRTWQRVVNVTTQRLTDIVVNSNGMGFIVGDAGTMLRTQEGLTRVEKLALQTISTFQLAQNYPNPFNATTTIEFQLSQPGDVSLNVYNLQGQLVREMLNDYCHAGNYTLVLQAESLPSGIYFYRLTTNEAIQTRKLVLQK